MDLIDRQSAIDLLLNMAHGAYIEAPVDEAVEAFRDLPSAEPELATNLQQSCNQLATDCISRQAAIDAFYIQSDDDGWWAGTVQDMEEFLKGLPSAEPEIIRCKDCRWGREVCGNIECFVDSNIPPEYHGYEWFCPNGERRTDG